MRLANEKFERILERYLIAAKKVPDGTDLDAIKIRYSSSFRQAIEFLEVNTSEDVLNLDAIGSGDATTFREQQEKFDALTRFFNAALKESSTGSAITIAFDNDQAPTLKSVLLDPYLRTADTLLLHTSPTNLGIREKYARGLLAQQHWLTDLDLQRMVKLTGNQSDIHVLPFEDPPLSVGTALHFAREAHHDAGDPYTISFLLNLGSSDGGQGIHWIAATITVNPESGAVSYQIDDSMGVNANTINRYKRIMEAAIRHNDGFHRAFPLATISGTAIGHATQRDGYSCGYRALHHLLQDSRLQKNDEARAYAGVSSTRSEDLVNAFYRQQLKDLTLTRDQYDTLDLKNKARFVNPLTTSVRVSVVPSVLDEFILRPPAKVTASAPKEAIPTAVTELVGMYKPGQITPISFPKKSDETLSAEQYVSLFESLSGLQAPISDFRLTHCNVDALTGLDAFYTSCEGEVPTLFNTLTIHISAEESDIDALMKKLQPTLRHLSSTNLSRLIIKDEKGLLKEAHIKAIIATASARSETPISFTIDLPETFQNTEHQRKLDMAIASNVRLKNSKSLEDKRRSPAARTAKAAPKRQREEISDLRAAMKTDVELQQGVEATVAIELDTTKAAPKAILDEGKLTTLISYDLTFAQRNNDYTKFHNAEASWSKEKFAVFYRRLFNDVTNAAGNILSSGESLSGITEEALRQLVKYHDYFEDGLNLQCLPRGFCLKVDPTADDRYHLHYDPTLENNEPLAPKLTSRPERPILSIDLVDELLKGQAATKPYMALWTNLTKSDTYPREKMKLFRQYLPELILLSDDQLSSTVELCGGVDSFNFEKLAFIFTHLDDAKAAYHEPYSDDKLMDTAWVKSVFTTPAEREKYIKLAHSIVPVAAVTHPLLNLLERDNAPLKAKISAAIQRYGLKGHQVNGLLAIYDKYGHMGLEKLLTAWDALTSRPNITPELIRSVYLNTNHYETLLLKPAKINDAVETISGFTKEQREWWQKLYEAHRPMHDDLATLVESFRVFSDRIAAKGLAFYSLTGDPIFKGAGNLPTTLSRIISILEHCPEADVRAQWQAISSIDLSPEGALRAMTDGIGDRAYRVRYSFILPEMQFSAQSYSIAPALTDMGQLYTYLAQQEHRLPVDFYEAMFAEIEAAMGTGDDEKTIPNDFYLTLCKILVQSTTGDNYRYFPLPPDEAKAQWRGIIESIKTLKANTPLAGKAFLKRTMLEQLNGIRPLPSLPILKKLVLALTAPIATMTTWSARNVVNKLLENKTTLNALLSTYKGKLYQGMAFYDEAEFARNYPSGRTFFEEYLHIANEMDKANIATLLLPLVSTFNIKAEDIPELKAATPPELLKDPLNPFYALVWDCVLDRLADIKSSSGLTKETLKTFLQALTPLIAAQGKVIAERLAAIETILRDTTHTPTKEELSEQTSLQMAKMMIEMPSIDDEMVKSGARLVANGIVLPLIEEQFKDSFPEHYFENLRAKKPKPTIQLLIDKYFKTSDEKKIIEKIQQKYSATTDEQLTDLIEGLNALTRRLSSAERIKLLDTLSSDRLSSAPIADYIQLLEAIGKQGSTSFTYFMSAAEKFPSVTELTTKATYFLSIALPQIRERQSPAYSEVEIVGLVADLVLAGKDKELAEEIDIRRELTTAYKTLNDAIKAAQGLAASIDGELANIGSLTVSSTAAMTPVAALETIRTALATLSDFPDEAALPDIKALETHLRDLTTLSTETVTIPAVTSEEEYTAPAPTPATSGAGAPPVPAPTTSSTAPAPAPVAAPTRGLMASLVSSIGSGFSRITASLRVRGAGAESSGGSDLTRSLESTPSIGVTPPKLKRTVVATPERRETRYKVKTLNTSLLEAAEKALATRTQETKSYTYAFTQTMALIENLIKKYPAAKTQLLSLGRHYLSTSTSTEKQIKQAFINLRMMHNELIGLDNQDLVLSLCEHFGAEKGTKSAFKLDDLLAIFQGPTYTPLPPATKKTVLSVMTALLNNGKPCSLKDIHDLVDTANKAPVYTQVLERLFKEAPYPTLDLIIKWIGEATQTELPPNTTPIPDWVSMAIAKPRTGTTSLIDDIFARYIQWNKAPVEREAINGFDLTHARKQAKAMTGISYEDRDLVEIDTQVKRVRDLTTQQLLTEIKSIKTPDGENAAKLVALMAELLYRTKGLPRKVDPTTGQMVDGRSFEINTTQYLAIHAMLKSGGHVTSQIETGEGKSRIMMIAIACQYALGNTVDFVTSDLSLARRDYLEYQSFFKVLRAETRLIYAQTAASDYRLGGINFSDASNLALFRNKARSEGDEALVLAKASEQRSLMLDEADKTYFDTSDTRFNYSAQTDETIRDMPWIYGLLIEFFSVEDNQALYHGPDSDADACNQAFYAFARSKLSAEQLARLVYNPDIPRPVVSRNQLEAWQSSALTALVLEEGGDYVIVPNITVQTKTGPTLTSQAQLLSSGRATGTAKFSFGVHQCLHARLNLLRKQAQRDTNPDDFGKRLKALDNDFYVDSENQIVYSSTSKSLLDDYNAGNLLAVTGTAGAIQEQEEARALFGRDTANPMTFIEVPRHRGQQRKDLPWQFAKDTTAQQQQILASVRDSLRRKQPVLLICENDTASKALYDFLDTQLTPEEKGLISGNTVSKLTRISASTSLEEEATHVAQKAGDPGSITISTAMLGRGTDIALHSDAKHVGLSVIGTYLPRERDYRQVIGRAGRFGAPGQSRLILDSQKLQTQLGTQVLPTELYTATEAYLELQQHRMDHAAQKQRVIKNVVGDFRIALTNRFFEQFYKPLLALKKENKDPLLASWQRFFDKADKEWNDIWPQIVTKLAEPTFNIAEIEGLLAAYKDKVQLEWKTMREEIEALMDNGIIYHPSGKLFVQTNLASDVGRITLSDTAMKLLQPRVEHPLLRTPRADHYDPAYVGRAVIYTNFADRWRSFIENIQAARRGEAPWFPNLQAVRNGNMSWSEFFFGKWGSPPAAKQPKVPAVAKPEPTAPSVGEASSPVRAPSGPKAASDRTVERLLRADATGSGSKQPASTRSASMRKRYGGNNPPAAAPHPSSKGAKAQAEPPTPPPAKTHGTADYRQRRLGGRSAKVAPAPTRGSSPAPTSSGAGDGDGD
jgi:hypothetical protein